METTKINFSKLNILFYIHWFIKAHPKNSFFPLYDVFVVSFHKPMNVKKYVYFREINFSGIQYTRSKPCKQRNPRCWITWLTINFHASWLSVVISRSNGCQSGHLTIFSRPVKKLWSLKNRCYCRSERVYYYIPWRKINLHRVYIILHYGLIS